MTEGKSDLLRSVRERILLSRDFDSFKGELLAYARRFYPGVNDDFSEASLGGLLLDFAAAVCDNMSFYADHSFAELDPTLAVEDENIERALKNAGITIVGSAPAVVDETFMLEVPAKNVLGQLVPDPNGLPSLAAGAAIRADNGVEFTLVDDLDFGELDPDGDTIAETKISSADSLGNPLFFIVSRHGTCVSGKIKKETFRVGSFKRFRRISLASRDISEIISVKDSSGNVYQNVGALTQDVVFMGIKNRSNDSSEIDDALQLVVAPFRFTSSMALASRVTTLTFGGGDADTLEDNVIGDPSEFAINLYGRKSFARFSIDPNRLLKTSTLGVAKSNTTLEITYRYGGGRSHNVDAGSINTIISAQLRFPASADTALISSVRSTLDATNNVRASGGDDPPTIDELRNVVESVRGAQSRVVTKPDLIARVYTMPTKFGRVFRAGVRSSRSNPLASQLFIASRDRFGRLTQSPDTLKKNLKTYISQFILSSDSIDILDSPIVNIGIKFQIIVDNSFNIASVLQLALIRVKKYMSVKNFQIDQPLVLDDLRAGIYAIAGVVAVPRIDVPAFSGTVSGRVYSDISFDPTSATRDGIVSPPHGGILECRFTDHDIIGIAG